MPVAVRHLQIGPILRRPVDHEQAAAGTEPVESTRLDESTNRGRGDARIACGQITDRLIGAVRLPFGDDVPTSITDTLHLGQAEGDILRVDRGRAGLGHVHVGGSSSFVTDRSAAP
jgi:hypothetical protein